MTIFSKMSKFKMNIELDINKDIDIQMPVFIGMMIIFPASWNLYIQQGVEGSLIL